MSDEKKKKYCPIQTTEYGAGTMTECTEGQCAWWSFSEEKCAVLMNAIGNFYHIWGKEK